MLKVKPYPAILEKTHQGYSVFFPDIPGAISAGGDYEEAVANAQESLSLHLYGMLQDQEKLPDPSPMQKILKKMDKDDLIALITPDI